LRTPCGIDDALNPMLPCDPLVRPGATLHGESLGRGPSALLLHAGGERRTVWRPILEQLAQCGFQGVAFDQRGHGESGTDPGGAVAVFGEDARAMIGRMISPVVVGASLGGFAALLALSDPATQAAVAGLVLVDVVPTVDRDRALDYLAHARADFVRSTLVADILDRTPLLCDAAADLTLPVLLVRGGTISPLQDDRVERFLRLVPQASVVTISHASHLVARDAPEELASVVADFLMHDEVRARRIARFHADHGTERISHPGGTLARHLHRTASLLRDWQSPAWLVDAAHLHAAYGTDGFALALTDARSQATLESLVGARAENLIRLYGCCERTRSYPTWATQAPIVFDRETGAAIPIDAAQRAALIELTVANELDVLAHDPGISERHGAELLRLFTEWRPLMSEAAWRAVESHRTASGTSVRS
jgi:pimeloyl-ACP methyl ester carboxylesterase